MGESERAAWIVNQLNILFPEATTQIVQTLAEALEHASDKETLIVLDRHCGIKEIMAQAGGWYRSLGNWPHPSMLYMLPFETCASNLVSRGGFDFAFDLELMRQKLFENTW